ncbi:MAG: agmatine deiminase family protein [Saprospiraceae bacterium]|nr:agmatine deiminase family protein [Saprospiraceae bacterium]
MTNPLHLLLLLLLSITSLRAQTDPDLPRFFTPDEQQMLLNKFPSAEPDFGFTSPPTKPVRAMAEWEELQALLITWRSHPTILTEIVRVAREECRVIICCDNSSIVAAAQSSLNNAGVDISSNVDFVVVPNNSIWIRDYGPNCVYANEVDSLYLIDWKYNRVTRPKDDTLSTTMAKFLDIPLYTTSVAPADLVNTGGNFMSDGMGSSFASRLILEENASGNPYGVSTKTEPQINQILYDYMGVQRYIKMNTLPYDAIHHIDMHMKLLDEETLLVGKYPDGIADGPQIEANIQYVLSQFTTAFGTPFKVIRIPMPPKGGKYPDTGGDYRTYANAVFVNKTVILPFYETQYDSTAQRIWEEALPGYTIKGIDCNAIIPSLGAIHCITKEIGVDDPLRIVHQEIPCLDNQAYLQYPVWATLEHRNGIKNARIHYTTDLNQPWQSVDLPVYLQDDTSWTHKGFIPKQAPGSTVYYYIEATAGNGRSVVRPLPAPKGYWSFCVTDAALDAAEVQNVSITGIYPNPASAITVVPVQTSHSIEADIRLYNAFGQCTQTIFTGTIPAGQSNYFLNASGLPAGTYWVRLQASERVVTQKLIIR